MAKLIMAIVNHRSVKYLLKLYKVEQCWYGLDVFKLCASCLS